MTTSNSKNTEPISFEIATEPDCFIQPLRPGGFGEGSIWDPAAKALIEQFDNYLEAKKGNPDATQNRLRIGLYGRTPSHARIWVQAELSNRVRKMTKDRDVKQGGRLRACARIGLDKDSNPIGLRVHAEPDFERAPRKTRSDKKQKTGTPEP